MTDQTKRASVGDVVIAYESFGDPADPPLLVVMGLGHPDAGLGRTVLRPARGPRFPRHPFRQPRHRPVHPPHREAFPTLAALIGSSPAEPAPPYTLLDMARDVEGLLDALELESAHVVGASMGGMIASSSPSGTGIASAA